MSAVARERFLKQSEEYVRQLYGRRCVRCSRPGAIVHEIVPRSKRPDDWWALENRVVLCGRCHEFIHQRGAMNFVDELRGCQARVLGVE